MKKLFLMAFIFTYVSVNVSNAQDHDHSSHQINDSDHQSMDHHMQASEISPAFQEQLALIYIASLEMKNALVDDNSKLVTKEAATVFDKIQKVDMKLLSGDAHMDWMKNQNTMRDLIRDISTTEDIAKQREYFAFFSDVLYNSIKEFGINSYKAYYQYCPMALNNTGAFWLSNVEEIQNPYMGQSMPKCGSTKEIIN
jgi:Cu(I)/Ag(I) efflux system membrane fusion protein